MTENNKINEENDLERLDDAYDWNDPNSIFKFLDDYRVGKHLLLDKQISDVKEVMQRLQELQKLANQNAKPDEDGLNKLVELYKLIK